MLLHIIFAYLMLLAALFNAICLHNAFSFVIDFIKCFCFHALSRVIDTLFVYFNIILHHAQCF